MSRLPDDFCIFILSHSRASNIQTLAMLKRLGYSGKWRVVVDDLDPQLSEYRMLYPDNLLVFAKRDIAPQIDLMTNAGTMAVPVFARSACFGLARQMGAKYFLVLDDDYMRLEWRYDTKLRMRKSPQKCKCADAVIALYLDYYKSVPQFKTLCMAQGGDFIGGRFTTKKQTLWRKAMNTFFCAVDREFAFLGLLNEDTNMNVLSGRSGDLVGTIPLALIQQRDTQQAAGGMTDAYLECGTYQKSYYSVMIAPSSVTIRPMRTQRPRLHHQVIWKYTVPQIVRED